MNLEKLNPWNWFKHENAANENQNQIPVSRDKAESQTITEKNPLVQLHREMDKLFDQAFSAFGMPASRSIFDSFSPEGFTGNRNLLGDYRPNIDVAGNKKQYEISLDVPGLKNDDLSIEVTGDVLTIKGRKEETKESKDKQFYRIERSYGSFQRTLSLPEDACADDIQANLKDGVLTLSIPRLEREEKDIKRIPISS